MCTPCCAAAAACRKRGGARHAEALTISNLSPNSYFSPNGDRQDDTTEVSYQLSAPAAITVTVRESQGAKIRTIQTETDEPEGGDSFTWDGHRENGSTVANGVYAYEIKATSAGGETVSAAGEIGVERGVPGVLSRPAPEATVSGDYEAVLSPSSGVSVSLVELYGRCGLYYDDYLLARVGAVARSVCGAV